MIKATRAGVCFDLDGTLLDTLGDLAGAMNSVLDALGLPTHEKDRDRFFVGDGSEKLVRRAMPPDRRGPADIAEGLALFKEAYAERGERETRPYPGVPEMLERLAALGGGMGIFTNKFQGFAEQAVERFLPREVFAVVVGARPGIPLKPHPQGALEVARALGRAPEECVYLGDSGVDMVTAGAAGMLPLGAGWGFRGEGELLDNGAARVLGHPMELCAEVERLGSPAADGTGPTP